MVICGGVGDSVCQQCSGVRPAAGKNTAGQIEKETNEHRTSNIERSTSNNVFCHFIIKLSKPTSLNRLRRSKVGLPFENMPMVCYKIAKAQRNQYWMFDVGRSMFDVQSVHCSDQANFI